MAITPKEKELAAVGISVAAGCKPCTDHHVTVARKARASDLEIKAAVAVALAVRRTAGEIMEAHASAQLAEAPGEAQAEVEVAPSLAGEADRLTALVSVGAAFAVNCVSSLERQLAAAEAAGIAADQIMQVVKLAAFIKRRAASHVERLAGLAKDEAA